MTATRRPLVAGNWKMNLSAAEGVQLIQKLSAAAKEAPEVDVAIAPSPVMLAQVVKASGDVRIYGQDVSEHPSGAYTGETALSLLVEAGARGTLIGHSERRHVFGEGLERIAAKVKSVVTAGHEVILCVGETLDQRNEGKTVAVVEEQMRTALTGVNPDLVTIAYEPVWAIGTGETASPTQAQEVHAAIRAWLRENFEAAADTRRLLYGGSVKPDNALELMSQPDIDGVLVGGASLKADSFVGIIQAAVASTKA